MYSLYYFNKPEIKYFFWLYGLLVVGFGILQINYSQQELFLFINSFVNSYSNFLFKIFNQNIFLFLFKKFCNSHNGKQAANTKAVHNIKLC